MTRIVAEICGVGVSRPVLVALVADAIEESDVGIYDEEEFGDGDPRGLVMDLDDAAARIVGHLLGEGNRRGNRDALDAV